MCVYYNSQYKECEFSNVEKVFCNSQYSTEKVIGDPVKVWHPLSPVKDYSHYSCSSRCYAVNSHYLDVTENPF